MAICGIAHCSIGTDGIASASVFKMYSVVIDLLCLCCDLRLVVLT